MSDSEDGAYASADEGSSTVKSEQTVLPKEEKKESNVRKKENVHKGQGDSGDGSKSKSSASSPGSNKGKARQQQPQNKKGKSKNQQTSSKTTEPTKVSTDSDSTCPNQIVTDKTKDESVQSKDQLAGSHTDVTDCDSASASKSDSQFSTDKTEETVASEDFPENKSPGTKESSSELKIESGGENKNSDRGWGWSSWGSSLLTAASTSVQTFTGQVGGGLSTIMDSVESSLGAPNPEELAKSNLKEENETADDCQDSDRINDEPELNDPTEMDLKKEESESNEFKGGGNWFASWGVAGIAKKVQDTGKSLASKGQTLMTEGFDAVENLASSGIDVLESLGKKTYNTLSEHDPAFKKTREYLRSQNTKPTLSSVLKDAKEQAEDEAAEAQENEEARKGHFETQFDEYQGIAHLEALEMLSNQSEKKVHSLLNSLSSKDLKDIKPILISIKEVFEVEEDQEALTEDNKDFSGLVNKYLSELELGSAPDKLNKVHGMVKQWLIDFDTQDSQNKQNKDTPKIVHQQAIQSLAELTSKGVEQFHKAGEMVLMEKDSDKDFTERAHSFARLTGVLCHEVGNVATKFTDCLNKITAEQEQKEDVTRLVTNIYLEATNSSTYIQDAFQLLLPILQQAAIEHAILSRQL